MTAKELIQQLLDLNPETIVCVPAMFDGQPLEISNVETEDDAKYINNQDEEVVGHIVILS